MTVKRTRSGHQMRYELRPWHRAGPPSAAQPLFILAMDHRDSFGRTLFGVNRTPDAGQPAGMRSAKELIFTGARQAAENTTGPGQLAILVDEQLGADVARQARKAGFVLAMPVETSGADRLVFGYGDDFAAHIEAFDPDWVPCTTDQQARRPRRERRTTMPDQTRAPAPTWQPPPDFEQFGGDLDAAERRELPASAYAFPRQRKEPLSSASHVRTALSRFDQVSDVSDADRALAFENIRLAASYFDVHITEKSWHDLMHPPSGR